VNLARLNAASRDNGVVDMAADVCGHAASMNVGDKKPAGEGGVGV